MSGCITSVVLYSINGAAASCLLHLDTSACCVEEREFRMYTSRVLIHLVLAGIISAVPVVCNSLPVFNYVSIKHMHAIALPAEASVLCDLTDCDEDSIQTDTKLQRELAKTPLPKNSASANEGGEKYENSAASKEHGSALQAAVNVGHSAEGSKKEELIHTTDEPETSSAVMPYDRRLPHVHPRKTRSIRNVALFRRAFKNIGKIFFFSLLH